MTNPFPIRVAAGALLCAAHLAGQSWTFVSIPDFQNNDIGSLADPQSRFPQNPTLPSGFVALNPSWDSSTANYEDSVDWIVSRLATHDPAFVTVAGDLVMGHWDRSNDGRNVFGPLSSDPAVAAAIDRAADYYYDIWLGRFDPSRNTHLNQVLRSRGRPVEPLVVHAAVGDHELGDNNWSAGGLKSRMVPTYKRAFGRWFTQQPAGAGNGTPRYANRPVGTTYEQTAYAFQHRNLLTVVVDEFRQDSPGTSLGQTGSVLATVDDGQAGPADDQLTWLDQTLAAGRADPTIDWIIVQGHMPVLRPVRARNSSNLGVRDADGKTQYETKLWQTLSRHRVDAYFCGEVHDTTLSRYGGVTQIVHGALIGNHSPINHLVVTVHSDRLEIESRAIDVQLTQGSLWQTGGNRPRADFEITAASRQAGYQTVGQATLTRTPGGGSVVTNATGTLAPFGTFVNGHGSYLVHHDFDQLVNGRYVNSASIANFGTPEGNAAPAAGRLGASVTLDGNQDRVTMGSTPIGGARPRTISLWLKTSVTSGLITALTMGRNSAGGKWDIDVDANNGGVLELGVGNGRTLGAGPALNDGRWHLVTTVLPDGMTNLADVRLFVDGQLASNGATNNNRAIDTGSGDLIVGHAANATWFQTFQGEIDDVVIWSEALSDAQVQSLFDVANSLSYSAAQFEVLLEVYRGNQPEANLGSDIWRRATGMTGGAGLTTRAPGTYELVFDPSTGAGVKTVFPSRVTRFGSGCTGSNGIPDILASGSPVLGSTTFGVGLAQARPNSAAALFMNAARGDLQLGGGCTAWPALPAISTQLPVSGSGQAILTLPIPASRSLIGVTLFGQWAVADPGGAFGPGLAAFSAGLRLDVGDV